MRRKLIAAVTFLGGIYFIVEFILPERFPDGMGPDGAWRGFKFREFHEEILTGLQSVGMAAVGLGIVNILRVFGIAVLKRRKGWQFSLTLILAMLAMMVVMFADWGLLLRQQNLAGPLGVQREFEGNLLDRIGRPAPDAAAAARSRAVKAMALGRYLADTRASVSSPDVGLEDINSHITELCAFLSGEGPAPAFFRLPDAPGNPPIFRRRTDLLAPPPEPPAGSRESLVREDLATPDGRARLAALAARRSELVAALRDAAKPLGDLAAKPPSDPGIPEALRPLAEKCREVGPRLRELAADARALADCERKAYKPPEKLMLLYAGGPEAPPPPPFGRIYLASRALHHAGNVLEKYANVLERAAEAIPAAESGQRSLAAWLAERRPGVDALRDEWMSRFEGEIGSAVSAAEVSLKSRGKLDAARGRMLESLRETCRIASSLSAAVTGLEEAASAFIARAGPDAGAAAKAEVSCAGAMEILRSVETPMRLHLLRRAEQDILYLDLDEKDRAAIVPPDLDRVCGTAAPAAADASGALMRMSEAAKARAELLEKEADEAEIAAAGRARDLRQSWSDKSSMELFRLRREEDGLRRRAAELRRRAAFVRDAHALAAEAAGKSGQIPCVAAVEGLLESLRKRPAAPGERADGGKPGEAAPAADMEAAIENAARTVEDAWVELAKDAVRALDRLVYKEEMKDVRAASVALSSAKAMEGAASAAAAMRRAERDARMAAYSIAAGRIPEARGFMASVREELETAREGMGAALAESAERSVIKGLRRVLFDGLFVSLGAAMFSLLAFYIASAAYRAFRVKSAEAALMMIAALIVMFGQIPFGGHIWGEFPAVRLWVMQVFSTPAFRGIALGAAVASLAMAMRMWLSLETGAFYREEDEADGEGAEGGGS